VYITWDDPTGKILGTDPATSWFKVIDNNITPRIDRDGDGLFGEDPVDGVNNDGDELIDEDEIDGFDNDGDGFIDEDPLDGINNDGDELIDEDGPDLDHMLWVPNTAANTNLNFLKMDNKLAKKCSDWGLSNPCQLTGTMYGRIVFYDPTGDTPDGVGLAGAQNDPNSNFLTDLIGDQLPAPENIQATFKFEVTGAGPGNTPPPPAEDEEIDNLIVILDSQEAAKEVNKKTSKDLRNLLFDAKMRYIDNGVPDAQGCALLQQFNDDVLGAANNKVSPSAKLLLTTGPGGVVSVGQPSHMCTIT